jgi:hypothetical protein
MCWSVPVAEGACGFLPRFILQMPRKKFRTASDFSRATPVAPFQTPAEPEWFQTPAERPVPDPCAPAIRGKIRACRDCDLEARAAVGTPHLDSAQGFGKVDWLCSSSMRLLERSFIRVTERTPARELSYCFRLSNTAQQSRTNEDRF